VTVKLLGGGCLLVLEVGLYIKTNLGVWGLWDVFVVV